MQAIVLGRRDFRETDQVVSFYTRAYGRLDLVAKGIKKVTSKNNMQLPIGAEVEIDIAKGKEFDYLTTAQCTDLFLPLRRHIIRRLALDYVLSLIKKSTHPAEVDSKVYDLYISFAHHLNQDAFQMHVVDAFLLKYLAVLGFAPSFDACIETGDTAIVAFAPAQGGVLSQIAATRKKGEEPLLPCNREDADALNRMLYGAWNDIAHLTLPSSSFSRIKRIVRASMEYHGERRVPQFNAIISKIGSLC